MFRDTCRRIVAATALAVGALAVGPPAGSALATPDDPGGAIVELETAGDEATAVELPAEPEQGQAAHSTMVMNVSVVVSGGGADSSVAVGLQVELSQEVVEVADDGSYSVLATLDGAEVTNVPDGADPAAVPCIGVTGLQIEQAYSPFGQLLGQQLVSEEPTDVEQQCADQLTQSTSQVVIAFPDEPIGAGAAWTVAAEVNNQGVVVPVTYRYTLVSVADGRYSADLTFDSSFDVGESGSGTMAGAGALSGALDNPLNQSASLEVALEITSPLEDGTDATVAMGMEVAILTS